MEYVKKNWIESILFKMATRPNGSVLDPIVYIVIRRSDAKQRTYQVNMWLFRKVYYFCKDNCSHCDYWNQDMGAISYARFTMRIP